MTQTMMSIATAPASNGTINFWVIFHSRWLEFPGFSESRDTNKPARPGFHGQHLKGWRAGLPSRKFPGFSRVRQLFPSRGALDGPKAAPRSQGKISTHSHLAPHSVPERKDEVSEDQMPQF